MNLKFQSMKIIYYVIFIFSVIQITSCKKETAQVSTTTPTPPQANRPPVANAGPDQTIPISTNTINLNGSGSTDPDNNITTYAWRGILFSSSLNIANANHGKKDKV
ncbi:MAG: hypothetical protein H0W75_10670 [Chitinophagaceae bacterium]|nr:hypothetical protein [Chitinophagaceae bacterium]